MWGGGVLHVHGWLVYCLHIICRFEGPLQPGEKGGQQEQGASSLLGPPDL